MVDKPNTGSLFHSDFDMPNRGVKYCAAASHSEISRMNYSSNPEVPVHVFLSCKMVRTACTNICEHSHGRPLLVLNQVYCVHFPNVVSHGCPERFTRQSEDGRENILERGIHIVNETPANEASDRQIADSEQPRINFPPCFQYARCEVQRNPVPKSKLNRKGRLLKRFHVKYMAHIFSLSDRK